MRVGRAPIDEEAIRLLEQHNPDVEFDWTRILKDPAPEPAPRRDRDGRDARDRDRRDRRDGRPPQRPRQNDAPLPAAVPAPLLPERVDVQEAAEAVERRAEAHAEIVMQQQGADVTPPSERAPAEVDGSVETGESLAVRHPEPLAADHTEYLEYVAASMGAEGVSVVESHEPASAAAARLGAEGLVRLRARYAEVMARITEKPMDEPAREELKTKAERLNPDGWVTADEVGAALEQYEAVFESVRAVVGRYPAQRRRRR